jgi:hypothetical protein
VFPVRYELDRLCGLVVRVLAYRSGGPGTIPGTTRKKSSGSGMGSTQPREYNWGATWYQSSGFCLENRECGRRVPSRWLRGTLYPQKLAITSPTSGFRSVGIVRSRTQTMEFVCLLFLFCEVRTEFIYVRWKKVDCLCGLVVRVPGYTTEMYCVSCEVQSGLISST